MTTRKGRRLQVRASEANDIAPAAWATLATAMALVALLALGGCSDGGADPTAPAPDPEPTVVSFAADIQPIFDDNCLGCHALNQKIVGPSYKDVAARYRGQKDAEATLVSHVLKGSKDVWGPVPMPANTNVTEAEAKKLVAWVLSLK